MRNLMAITFHELRNPLNGTEAHLQLALDRLASHSSAIQPGDAVIGAAAQTELTEMINSALVCTRTCTRFMGTLSSAQRLLTCNSPSKTKLRNPPPPTDLHLLCLEAATILRPLLMKGVELQLSLPPEATWVSCDGTALLQCIINLGQNSARFTREGHVSLRCKVEKKEKEAAASDSLGWLRCHFIVRDTGSGMTPEVIRTLYDPYVTQGGLGLGMYLTKEVLESQLGSSLEVESSPHPPSFSQFRFTVRVQCTQPPSTQVEDAADDLPPLPEKLRILLADDIKMNRVALKLSCKQLTGDWEWVEVETAEAALEKLRDPFEGFGLVIMDENFDKASSLDRNSTPMRGSEAIRVLRTEIEPSQNVARIPVISCSGYSDVSNPEHSSALLEAGADIVWGKPLPKKDEMKAMLQELLCCSANDQVITRVRRSLPDLRGRR